MYWKNWDLAEKTHRNVKEVTVRDYQCCTRKFSIAAEKCDPSGSNEAKKRPERLRLCESQRIKDLLRAREIFTK